jgi:hypothetical protein
MKFIRAILLWFAIGIPLMVLAMVVSASIFSPESREGKNLFLVLATIAGIVTIVTWRRLLKS